MDVSIIIVNYNTSALLLQCVDSIYARTSGIDFEVIVVDNASEESSVGALRSDPRFRLIEAGENLGFGRANNLGFEQAKGRYILCLNPDTLLLNNAVEILTRFLDSTPEAGACGGNLFDEKMSPTLSFRRILPGIFWECNELLHHLPERLRFGRSLRFNFHDVPVDVAYITGADLMIRSEVIRQTGGFSPSFFMYYEETDLCARIHALGWKIFSVPAAHIQHLEGKSFGPRKASEWQLHQSERGRLIYYGHHHSRMHTRIADVIYGCFLWSRAWIKKSPEYRFRYSLHKKSADSI